MDNKEKPDTQNATPINIDEANRILDRVIGFVGHCDNKAGVILTLYGIVAAIVFSGDVLTRIIEIIKMLVQFKKGWLFFSLLISFLNIIIGICYLVASLLPKTSTQKYIPKKHQGQSVIFFGDISASDRFNSYKQYHKNLINQTDEEYLKDITMEIYINSKICSEKFRQYKTGVLISLIGMGAFGIVLVICMFFL